MKLYQPSRPPKIRWSGFLTTDNFDWLCHISHLEDLSLANIINRIIKEKRLSVPRENPAKDVVKSNHTLQSP